MIAAAFARAIAVARLQEGATAPNPAVGCVLLDAAGTVLIAASHPGDGQSHAEARAIAMAREAGWPSVFTQSSSRWSLAITMAGPANKMRAFALQDKGLDTVEANRALGLPEDGRDRAAFVRCEGTCVPPIARIWGSLCHVIFIWISSALCRENSTCAARNY